MKHDFFASDVRIIFLYGCFTACITWSPHRLWNHQKC